MRKLMLIAAPLALAACSSEAVVEEEVVEAETVEAVTTANGTPVGLTAASSMDGEALGTTAINADGTYQDYDAAGELNAEGTWAVVDGKTCFEPTTEGVESMCWTESEAAEDGSFTATPDEGDAVMVTPVPAEEDA